MSHGDFGAVIELLPHLDGPIETKRRNLRYARFRLEMTAASQLRLGADLHVGKGTGFGLGRYEICR